MSNQEASVNIPEDASFSKTEKEVVKLNHIWTIENFNFFLHDKVVQSPTFSAVANDGIQWLLKLYPNGNSEDNKDYVSVFLRLRSCSRSAVLLNFRILILTADRAAVGEMTPYKPERLKPGTGSGYSRLIKQRDLLGEQSRYLRDNKLTVRCDVWYTVDSEENSSPAFPLQLPKCTLSGAFGDLCESQTFSDATMLLNGKEFPVHRAILSARSPIFKAMFERNRGRGECARFHISDMDEDTFVALLRFIYTGRAENSDNMINLLATIDKHLNPV